MLAHFYYRIGVIIKVNSIEQMKIGKGEIGDDIKKPSHFDRMCDFFDPDNCNSDIRKKFNIAGSANRIRNTIIHGGNKSSLGYRSMVKNIDKEIIYMKKMIEDNMIVGMREFLGYLSSECAFRLEEKRRLDAKKKDETEPVEQNETNPDQLARLRERFHG